MSKSQLVSPAQKISYMVRRSSRAMRLRIAVYTDGSVVITKPNATSTERLEQFVESKKSWIMRKLEWHKTLPIFELRESSFKHFKEHRDKAFELIMYKIEHWNKIYDFDYETVEVKRLKSRWGSCSGRGKLYFNYKILFLPERFQDYVVIHELCHLKELSHSPKFWALVSKALPDYYELNKIIKRI